MKPVTGSVPRINSPVTRVVVAILIAGVALIAGKHSHAQQGYVNLPLLGWPLSDEHRYILAYPDTPYTWAVLGLVEGTTSCPRYYERDYATSYTTWRDPALPEATDWLQASLGNRGVACYRAHRGTDIIAPPMTPVFAIADGTVTLVEPRITDGYDDAAIEIAHEREFRETTFDWIGHYAHLSNRLFVAPGDKVQVGQMIGYVAAQGTGTHLHIGVEGIWECTSSSCIQSPFGPVDAWIDYGDNSEPDPATTLMADAPAGVDLVHNGGFSSLAGWYPTDSLMTRLDAGRLVLGHESGGGRAALEQVLAYRFKPDQMLQINLQIENISDRTRFVGVSLRSTDTWLGYLGCPFMIPPRTPSMTYTVTGPTSAEWANALLAISVNPADGQSGIVIDHVQVKTTTNQEESCAITP